jgi:hypothetical protein
MPPLGRLEGLVAVRMSAERRRHTGNNEGEAALAKPLEMRAFLAAVLGSTTAA